MTKLPVFERYLSLWVAISMAVGLLLGKVAPGLVAAIRGIEFGEGSQINATIAVLIWLMITPMMMKVDFAAVKDVGKKPRGLLITLLVNWLVKPFSMAACGLGYSFASQLLRGLARVGFRPVTQINTSRVALSWRRLRAQRWCLCGAN